MKAMKSTTKIQPICVGHLRSISRVGSSSRSHYFLWNIFCFINLLLIWEAVRISHMPLSEDPVANLLPPSNCSSHQRVLVIAKRHKGKVTSGGEISHMAHATASVKMRKDGKTERKPTRDVTKSTRQENCTSTLHVLIYGFFRFFKMHWAPFQWTKAYFGPLGFFLFCFTRPAPGVITIRTESPLNPVSSQNPYRYSRNRSAKLHEWTAEPAISG